MFGSFTIHPLILESWFWENTRHAARCTHETWQKSKELWRGVFYGQCLIMMYPQPESKFNFLERGNIGLQRSSPQTTSLDLLMQRKNLGCLFLNNTILLKYVCNFYINMWLYCGCQHGTTIQCNLPMILKEWFTQT